MANVDDIDEILDGLSYDDLQALSEEIDPEHDLLPVHERQLQPPSNRKFDINGMIKEMEKMSVESIEGENYLPLHSQNWKPTETKKDEPTDAIPEEWNEALDQASEEDLQELAGILGVHSVLTQEQSFSKEKGALNESLRDLSSMKGAIHAPSQDVSDHYQELQHTDVTALFRQLKNFDKELSEIILNNMKEVDDVLLAVADYLEKMDSVKRISVANTKMSANIGMRFAEALKKNTSLVYLNMESNYLSGEVIVAILEAIENNTVLTELKVSNQSKAAGSQNEREMVKRLERNHSLRKFGYAFQAPGVGSMASRLIMRNNDEARKARLSASKK